MSIEETRCPKCNGPMVSRKSKYGVFWGCKDYPNCDGTRDNMGEDNSKYDLDDLPSNRQRNNDRFRFNKS